MDGDRPERTLDADRVELFAGRQRGERGFDLKLRGDAGVILAYYNQDAGISVALLIDHLDVAQFDTRQTLGNRSFGWLSRRWYGLVRLLRPAAEHGQCRCQYYRSSRHRASPSPWARS